MGKGGKVPDADPRIGEAALKEAQTGEDALNFYTKSYDDYTARQSKTDDLADQVSQQALDSSKEQQQWAETDRNRYENTFVPLQDEYIDKAKNWDTPTSEDAAAAAASAGVQQQGDAAAAATQRQQAAMGVNPSSGRFQGITSASNLATGLASAGAANTTRRQLKNEGMSYLGSAANLGQGLGTQALSDSSSATSTGSSALQNNLSASQGYLSGTSLMGQGYGSAMSGYGSEISGLNTLYNEQANAFSQRQQQAQQGFNNIMSGVGAATGLASAALKI